jgi:hypothetical protein
MDQKRRSFLGSAVPLALGAALAAFARRTRAQDAPTRPMGQNRSRSAAEPFPESSGASTMPKPDPKQILRQNKKQIQEDVEKLYKLAGELKDQVAKTDSENVLSLPLVQKAEQIEKLAKQIKNLARGE